MSENQVLIPLWKNKAGFHAMPIDARSFEQVQAILANVEPGGKFVIYNRKKEKSKETDPDAYFKYLSASEVAEGATKRPVSSPRKGGL